MRSINTHRLLGFALVAVALAIMIPAGALANSSTSEDQVERTSTKNFMPIAEYRALQARSAQQGASRKLLQLVTTEDLIACSSSSPKCGFCGMLPQGAPCWDDDDGSCRLCFIFV